MTRPTAFFVSLIIAASAFVSNARAQSSNLQYQVANLVEDFRLLDERMRMMASEMDELRRENARLKSMVEEYERASQGRSGSYATVSQVNELVRKTVSALEARDEVVKKEVVDMVAERLESFGRTVNKAINSVPTVAKPDPNIRTSFDLTNVPKTGISYTVQPGDSLASIAKNNNSRIDWIQNINKISDPRLLQVGQVIFVPQDSQ